MARSISRRESLFNQLVTFVEPTIRRTICKYLPNQQDAEDSAQEVLLRLWKHLYKVPKSQVTSSAWACTTSKHIALDLIRRQQRESRNLDRNYHVDISSSTDDYEPFRIWQFPDSANTESKVDLQQQLANAFRSLPLPQRQALLMVAEGCSYIDVANAQNEKVGTVRSRIHYARQHLRRELDR